MTRKDLKRHQKEVKEHKLFAAKNVLDHVSCVNGSKRKIKNQCFLDLAFPEGMCL